LSVEATRLPLVLAGPILRKVTEHEVNLWLATSEPLIGSVEINNAETGNVYAQHIIEPKQQLQIGTNAWVCMLTIAGSFPTQTALNYQIDTQLGSVTTLMPHLYYSHNTETHAGIRFMISEKADYVLHGSCRNPHHFSDDALVAADTKISTQDIASRPDMLIMSGDQIYADHVAGPTLSAIEQTINLLGLPSESFEEAPITNSNELYHSSECYYGRDKLLPHYVDDGTLLTKLFPHRNTPVFSSTECENHLISFAEYFAMYLLVWSPTVWDLIDLEQLEQRRFETGGKALSSQWQKKWYEEKKHIHKFVSGLKQVQRLLAHIPTYMIFDDHDITDDWNLTVGWEKAAYDNLFSRRIIGNGLIAYWLCQGWGNAPEKFSHAFLTKVKRFLNERNLSELSLDAHDDLILHLYRFEGWHYTIHTSPKVVVLDTRTRRWRSESRMNKPSGLLDWEAMTEFQQELLDQSKVIIISAAPIFGVKFIEMLQRTMTIAGHPLVIDAENWMAHPGSANTLISIFTHTKTPTNFVILSGDVHYSFAYDAKLRHSKNSPNIYQITCSGIKNQFPDRLLKICDALDTVLYSPRSPLNWFTKRKSLKITKRHPDTQEFYRLVNQSAIGELRLDDAGKPKEICLLTSKGEKVNFPDRQ